MTAGSHSVLDKYIKDLMIQYWTIIEFMGAQWLRGRVLDSRPRGSGIEPHRRHCVVILEQDTFILT